METKEKCSTVLKESCYDVPESECAEVARTVTETRYVEECRAVQEQRCEVRPEKKCKPMMEEVSCVVIAIVKPSASLLSCI